MKKKYRRLFHDHGVHDYCVIVQEKEVVGHDYSPQYLSGLPNEDGTREFFEVT